MKVKVIGCKFRMLWYSDRIGDIFNEVELFDDKGTEGFHYRTKLPGECGWSYFIKDDVEVLDFVTQTVEQAPNTTWTDAHYASFSYALTEDDKKAGSIKVDPYFVAKQWGLGKRDDSGILFHNLKTIARFGDKNSREREIVALYKQVKRLAEIEGVILDN